MNAEEISKEEAEFIEKLAEKIVGWGMATPATFFLEAGKPFNFFAGQAIFFSQPFLSLFFPLDAVERLARLLEKRSSIEAMLKAIEARACETGKKHNNEHTS